MSPSLTQNQIGYFLFFILKDLLFIYYICSSTESPPKDKQSLCLMCSETEFNAVFLPCGHINSCEFCALKFKKCPVCRCDIKTIHKVYLPY